MQAKNHHHRIAYRMRDRKHNSTTTSTHQEREQQPNCINRPEPITENPIITDEHPTKSN